MCFFFRSCCDRDKEDSDDEETLQGTSLRYVVGTQRMTAQEEPSSNDSRYQVVVSTTMDVERVTDAGSAPCCQPPSRESIREESGISRFLRKLQEGWKKYDSLETISSETESNSVVHETYGKTVASPLRTALNFDLAKNSMFPTIRPDEVVLPGSSLQKEMSQAMARTLGVQSDECVICMEGFDATNPRMPTLCGCGENKTYFHLPCLYQWLEQSNTCPICRQRLRWEEF